MSNLFVDKISGKSGTSSGAPITLSGDTATLSSGVTIPAAGITGTLDSGVFSAGHVIQAKSITDGDVVGTATDCDTVGDVVNSGIELTIGSGNKALILVTGWQFTRRSSGASSDRVVHLYKEVSGSDTSLGIANAWGEVVSQYVRAGFSCCCLDTTTGVVRYKLKVQSLGTAGRIEYKTNMIVLEVTG